MKSGRSLHEPSFHCLGLGSALLKLLLSTGIRDPLWLFSRLEKPPQRFDRFSGIYVND